MHAIIGGKEFAFIKPTDSGKPREVWSQALCGWHWVSVDQLLVSGLLLVVGFSNIIHDESLILLVIGIYFALTGIIWLLTALVSGREIENAWLKLGQWMYCFLISGLALLAR